MAVHCTDCAAEGVIVRVDVDGRTSLATSSTRSGAPLRLLVEVTSEADVTTVVVRSALQLHNGCALPLDCLLYSPQLAREVTLPSYHPCSILRSSRARSSSRYLVIIPALLAAYCGF